MKYLDIWMIEFTGELQLPWRCGEGKGGPRVWMGSWPDRRHHTHAYTPAPGDICWNISRDSDGIAARYILHTLPCFFRYGVWIGMHYLAINISNFSLKSLTILTFSDWTNVGGITACQRYGIPKSAIGTGTEIVGKKPIWESLNK